MVQNVGTTDRLVRLAAGMVLLNAAYFAEGALRWISLPGAGLVLTAALGVCPVYWPFGFNTCSAPVRP